MNGETVTDDKDIATLVRMARQILRSPSVVTAAGLAVALAPFDHISDFDGKPGDESYPTAFQARPEPFAPAFAPAAECGVACLPRRIV